MDKQNVRKILLYKKMFKIRNNMIRNTELGNTCKVRYNIVLSLDINCCNDFPWRQFYSQRNELPSPKPRLTITQWKLTTCINPPTQEL